jgi:hypothetical protein
MSRPSKEVRNNKDGTRTTIRRDSKGRGTNTTVKPMGIWGDKLISKKKIW